MKPLPGNPLPARSKNSRPNSAPEWLQQKLLLSGWNDTLAQLTPGLLHDFNNVLTGILGLSEGFLAQIDSGHAFHEGLSLIQSKARQASQLVQRMHNLWQEKPGSRSHHDLNTVVTEICDLLQTAVPKLIHVSARPAPDPVPVHLDGTELRQVLLGLALSILKAIPGQGELLLLVSRSSSLPSLRPGQTRPRKSATACLEIKHTGRAFTKVEAEMLFDPFTAPGGSPAPIDLNFLRARLFADANSGAISAEGTSLKLWLPESDFSK